MRTDINNRDTGRCVISLQNRQKIKYGVNIYSHKDKMIITKSFYNLNVEDVLDYKLMRLDTKYYGFHNAPKWLSKMIDLNYNKDIEVTMDKGETYTFCSYTYGFEIIKDSKCLMLKDSFDHLTTLKDYNRNLSSIRKMIKSLTLEEIIKLSSNDDDFITTIKYENLEKLCKNTSSVTY
tara:strand:+ start:82606 stop:83139 length:534 start_codon:yes stop_codon:yes gene_type:complete